MGEASVYSQSRMKSLMAGAILCLACFGKALAAENKAPQSIPELQSEIERVLQQTGTAGAAVAIVSPSGTEWVAGLGLADVASKKPVTTHTLFRIGSISKEFVALAALKLEEEGKLKLGDTLRHWLPEHAVKNAWEATDPVRLVHLLEHTSGIPDWRFSEMAHNDPGPVILAQALAFAPQYRVTRWRPGSRYAYSNVGPALVAAVIEKASGQRFEDYVQANFFGPLGMKTASYFLTPEVRSTLATMYWSGNKDTAPYTHLIYRPSGAVSASIEDMANYVRFHLQRGSFDGQRILLETSMERLERPTSSPAARAGVTTGYGLYNRSFWDHGYEWHGHDGEWDGAESLICYCQELGLGLVILMNSNNGYALHQIQSSVGRYLMRNIPSKSLPAPAPLPVALKAGSAEYYANIAPRDEGFTDFTEYFGNVRLVRVDKLGMTWQRALGGWPQRWLAVSDKLFRRDSATKPALALISGEKGERLFQSDEGTFQRISGFGFWLLVGGVGSSLVFLFSAVLFAFIWVPRKALGGLRNSGPLAVRSWPLAGAVGVLGILVFYANVQEGWVSVLGSMNAWTIGVFLLSLLFPVSALFSVVALWRSRRAPINRAVFWHAVLVTFSLVFMTGFGWCWNLIGARLWA